MFNFAAEDGPRTPRAILGNSDTISRSSPKEFLEQDRAITDSSIIQTLSVEDLRARTEVIACEFFRLCMLAVCRESMRAKASRRAWIAMSAFMILYFVGLILQYKCKRWQTTLPAVLFAGAVGGFISAQRRIQSVTDHGESLVGLIELSSLSTVFSYLWAPVSGAIFAVVLYAMFAGHLILGEIFPNIQTNDHLQFGVFTRLFSSGSGPTDGVSAAKLIIWCFIAGFAERFVPDALARFVSKADATQKKHKDDSAI